MNYAILPGMQKKEPNIETKDKIIEVVCKELGCDMYQISSSWRKREVVKARQIICYLLYKHCNYSLKDIGAIVNKDHTTIISSNRRTQNYIDTEPEFQNLVTKLSALIFST